MTDGHRDGGHPRRLDDDLGWMLGVLFRAYAKAAEHALHDLPGGPRGYQVLTAAVAEPPRNQGAISEELGVDRTVLTYLIDDLAERGLVTRRPDPADRRSRLIVATDEGAAMWRRCREELRHVEAHLLGPLDPANATAFRSSLRRLACEAQTRDPLRDLCTVVRQARSQEDGNAFPDGEDRSRTGPPKR
ncbi:DNA-binding transcriptional regulator, MarR family [Marinactinospora thermotolerans DSM 45154]|uniref:DNA-binding transcriptional regulator, MarR family n=1 Tax=Marinactinospora thermotolerans DSM 45154 TaxID=1122192 RepID=A0A1T4PGI1_9ACTN|nr:MarR family transcriptional regulator [Marinactinospora thermotolerans]SJZ90683.1 DNA-binding transcriptional regulator, MarR family [Marinactinospora thermotolerans DSM 45154]